VLFEYQKVSSQTKNVKAEINEIEPKLNQIKADSEKIRQSLNPEQQVLLRSAHNLVDRRRFSWSRLFSDLESVLPGNVSVSHVGIRDVVDQGGGKMLAELDFSVMSKDYQSVVNMLNEMNNSGKFQSVELRAQDLQPDKGNLTEYSMQLRYLPSAGVPVANVLNGNDLRLAAATPMPNNLTAEVNNQ
jgi:Tfp pilus assembly protein PilN